MTEEILNSLREALAARLSDHPEIRFAILYGSATEGANFHDLDVAVFVDRIAIATRDDLDYSFVLADELEAVVSFPVDVRVINDAPLPFRFNVSRGTPLVVRDPQAFFAFLERTWDEYLDFQPVAMQYLREM